MNQSVRSILCRSLLAGVLLSGSAHAGSREDLLAGSQVFACNLYRQLGGTDGNLFFSPFSISMALTMTSAGARGTTEAEILKTLQLKGERDSIHAVFSRIMNGLNAAGTQGDVELAVANALWGQQGFGFRREFVDYVGAQYGAGFREVDFRSQPEGARQEVNGWVEENTKKRIRNLFPEGSITEATRLVLANAIYFKGKWETEFRTLDTRPEPFALLDGSKIDVPMMQRTGVTGYVEGPRVQVAVLPYRGGDVSMVILLPREADGIRNLEKDLDADLVETLCAEAQDREVILSMPKFTVTQSFDLSATLAKMGINDLFTPGRADLSGMDGKRDLSVSLVMHRAFVDVNEEGTEAAAATGIAIETESADPSPYPVFRADHPFIFLLRDSASGAILFMGRIENPVSSK
jgi:serpin B